MTNTKKTVTICLAAMLLLPLFPTFALLAQEEQTIEGVTDQKLVDETWMSDFGNGVQIGYTHSRTFNITYKGAKATLIESTHLMRAKIRGQQYEATSTTTLIMGEKYEPLYFKVVKGSGRHEMSTEGRREGDTMVSEKHSPWTSSQVNIPLGPGILFSGRQLDIVNLQPVENGKTYVQDILDIEDLQVKQTKIARLERNQIMADSSLGIPQEKGPWYMERWSFDDNIVQYWKNSSGDTWRREQGNQYSVRTTEEKANDFSAELDIWDNIAFKSDKVILNSKQTNEMDIRFKATGVDCRDILAEGERLQILHASDQEDTCVISLRSTAPSFDESTAVDLPIDAERFRDELKATTYVQSGDTTIAKTAREVVGDERDAYQAAVKLCQWVHFNVNYQFLFTNVTARDVLKSKAGDCSEFSLLYTALARAAGIPTRQCQGIVYGSDGKFYRHAWIESWVGQWVAMDPTWNELVADATHLKFGEIEGEGGKSITPVDIEILDYQYEIEGRAVRMRDIDLDLSFAYNDSASKGYDPLRKDMALMKKRSQSGVLPPDSVEGVRRRLAEFIAQYPRSITAVNARHVMAETYFWSREYEMAISELEAFIETYSFLAEDLTSAAWRKIGEGYLRLKQYDKALEVFQKIKERYPQAKAVDDMVIDVEEIAHHLRSQGQYEKAIDQYREMMDLFPARKTIYQEKLADIYYSQGEHDKALEQYENLIMLYPDRKTIYNEQIALLYRRAGRIDEAIARFREMMALSPEKEKVYREQIAEIYKKEDRLDEALAMYEDLIRDFPEREIIYREQIAKLHQSRGEHDLAIAQYMDLCKRFPEKATVCYEQIAKIHLKQEEYEQAVAQYEQLLDRFPERKMIYQEQIALVYEKAGLHDKAVARYRALISQYPDREKIYSEKIEKLLKE